MLYSRAWGAYFCYSIIDPRDFYLLTKKYYIMYTNTSTDEAYPKTLIIRNHEGGMIWQIYHVQAEHEAARLSANATRNGFQAITLEDYQPDEEETWSDWRETDGGKKIIDL